MSKMPYIGEMDQLIELHEASETLNPTGGKSLTWAAVKSNVWAKVEQMAQSDEQTLDGLAQVVASNQLRFTIRYDPDFIPNEKMRIVYDGDNYDIIVIDKIGRNQFRGIEAVKRDNE